MLGITSYFDVKTRMVPDVIWLIFGGIGTILYVFDYQNMTSYHVIALIMGGFVSFMIWRWRHHSNKSSHSHLLHACSKFQCFCCCRKFFHMVTFDVFSIVRILFLASSILPDVLQFHPVSHLHKRSVFYRLDLVHNP